MADIRICSADLTLVLLAHARARVKTRILIRSVKLCVIIADGEKRGPVDVVDIVNVSCTPLEIACKPDSKSTPVANQAMSCNEVDGNFDDESKLKVISSAG